MLTEPHILASNPVSACRSCAGTTLFPVLDLGLTPLADRLVPPDALHVPDHIAPLALIACTTCSLAQLSVTVPPDILFRHEYPYYSSVSPALNAHFRQSAERLIAELPTSGHVRVIEAASNDGYMLRHFKKAGFEVLGVDPAAGPARHAQQAGIETLVTYFTTALVREHGLQADLFIAHNVLAHVPDIHDFVAAIAAVLKPDGRAVIETPYLDDLIRNLAFDTIYHQHVFYYSVTALKVLFERHGLYLNDCERLTIHGGSLRLKISRNDTKSADVQALLTTEAAATINSPAYYAGFTGRIDGLKQQLCGTLRQCHDAGKRIAGYGAAAKAVTLLAHTGIGTDFVDYIVDKNPVKQGQFMPGTRIPIRPLTVLADDPPDYLLLLAWNFANEIMAQETAYYQRGGKFIVPIPEFRII